MLPHGKLQRGIAGCLLLLYIGCCSLVAFALYAGMNWPEASGEKRYSRGSLTVDASHADDGYIMARGEGASGKLKLRVSRGEETYTYDINNLGEFETFPLQMGSGGYTVSLFKNLKGNKYSKEGTVEFSADMPDENAAFLYPNQYVNYTPDCPAVALSMQICEGLTTDREKFEAVRGYIKANFLYDYVKATTVPAGSMPDIDGCLETHMGICQDLTALAACMLRVQGIPAKLVIGYADRSYHAWNNVLIDGEYVMLDVTADLKGISGNVVYTVERCY